MYRWYMLWFLHINVSMLVQSLYNYNFLKGFIVIFREGKGRRKRGRDTSMCGWLSRIPNWGAGLQPRHVPWVGIETVTPWFIGWHPVHWTTPARATIINLNGGLIFHQEVCAIIYWIPYYLFPDFSSTNITLICSYFGLLSLTKFLGLSASV